MTTRHATCACGQLTLSAEMVMPVGAFADAGFPSPTASNYGERTHRWVRLDEGIRQND